MTTKTITRHNKHCTYKKTLVCICTNLDNALKEQAKRHENELQKLRLAKHNDAVGSYREGIIRAFTNLIDDKFEADSDCDCSDYTWRRYG